jgi:DNA transformation protein
MSVEGCKGAKLTADTTEAGERAVEVLLPLGDVTSKRMFGGYGIFIEGKMFALIDAEQTVHFKVDGSNEQPYLDAGALKHGRMPYRQVPETVWTDEADCLEWAQRSADIALGRGR